MTGVCNFAKKYNKLLLSAALFFVMYAFLLIFAERVDGDSPALLFSAVYLLCLLPFALGKSFKTADFLAAAAVSAAFVYVRVCFLCVITGDYSTGFNVWMDELLKYEGAAGLGAKIGNYNTPYMAILLIIARSGFSRIMLLKWVSCLFDVMLAYFVMKCVELKSRKPSVLVISFCLAFGLPTVFLNSSCWGQCDAIFTAFSVSSVYFGLKGKSPLCILMFSLGFIFKLHPIFLAVGFAALFMTKRIRLRDLWILPAVYAAAQIPAILSGMNAIEALMLPFTGIEGMSMDSMTISAPTLWALLENAPYEYFSTPALFITGGAVVGFGYYVYSVKDRIKTGYQYLLIFYISSMLMVYLLPSMHDRYYCISDILSVILLFYNHRLWYITLITCAGSLLSYVPYLFGRTPVGFPMISLFFLLVIVLMVREFMLSASGEARNEKS